jgi:glycosyltransferase involved in cell wall biosynthesis
MRLVFFNRSYYPDFGATGQLLTELCEGLTASYGAQVTVVAGMPLTVDAPLSVTPSWWRPVRRDERNGVRILRAFGTRCRPRRFVGRFSNYISYFVSAALATLRIGRADVVVALTDPPIIGLVAGFAARLSGARMVFLCEDVFPEVARLLEDFQSPRIEALLSRVSRHVARRADGVVALGDTMKRRLVETKGADPGKITVIHNWADTQAIVPAGKDNPFSLANGLADKFVLMHSGNVGLSQNVGVLLDVAERLRHLPDFRVAIVGDGASKAALVGDAARRGLDNVVFFPYQPKENLSNLFSTADAFLVSLKQGLAGFIVPSKLYGILAGGRPFVVSADDDCEAAAIARDYDCGLVVRPGDVDGISAAVRCLYDNPARRQAMGANARRAGERFDRSQAVAAYERLFRELSDGRAG